jgi:hypothetical protein
MQMPQDFTEVLTLKGNETIERVVVQVCGQSEFLGWRKSDTMPWSLKKRLFWISGIGHRINGINVLSIEVSPKEDTNMWKTSFLILDSPYQG